MQNIIYGRIIDMNFVPSNRADWVQFLTVNEDKDVVVKKTTYTRTDAQNNALHKYFEMVSTALTEKGLTFDYNMGKKVVKLEWTPTLVKEAMWKPIMKALTSKTSTTQMDKVEDINKIYDHINRFLSETYFIYVPFPSEVKEDKLVENYPINDKEITAF